MIPWSLIVFVVCLASSNFADTNLDKSRELLMKHLLTNYHPSVRPARWNETIMVSLKIELQHFDFKERDGSFHLVGLMHVKWRDPKLIWHPRDFGNMSHITISQRRIWVPDLEFYTDLPNKFMLMHRYGFVSVKSDGNVFWSDNFNAHAACTTNMKNWPHDKHECHLSMGSWTTDAFEVDIIHTNSNASMSFNATDMLNMQYKVIQYEGKHKIKTYPCCQEFFITMNYYITFERQSKYAVIFRIPAITVIMFTLLALYMEPERTEKFYLNAISLLIICGNQLYFAFNGRNFGRDLPNIVVFFRTSFILATITQGIAVFSRFATSSTFKPRLGTVILRFLNSPWMWRIVPGNPLDPNTSSTSAASDCNDGKLDNISSLLASHLPQNDWHRLAKLVQRLFFILFAFCFLILSSVCFI